MSARNLLARQAMLSWSEQLFQSHFLSSKEGRVVFFPFGPFKAFSIPRPATQRVILSFLKRITVISLASSAITTVIGALFGFGFTTLVAIGLINLYLWYFILIRRVTRRLLPLQFALGFRFYAQCFDEQRLWMLFFTSILFSVVGVYFLLVNACFVSIVGTAMFGSLSLITGLLIYVRYRKPDQVE